MKIWHRYLFKQLALSFISILFFIFSVYVLVDLSVNGVRFLYKGTSNGNDVLLYYLRQFATHLELFLPLGFLLSCMKVLFQLNTRLELVALQMAGISRKKLLAPFFFFAGILSLSAYLNYEWFAPDATKAALEFKTSHSKHKRKLRREHVQAIALDDDSELIYQFYDEKKQELFDLFWIRSSGDIWHMKRLNIATLPPQGFFVDHFVRKKHLEKEESFDTRLFPEIPLTQEIAPKPFIPFECRPLSTLFYEALYASSDKAGVRTHLNYKLALPLLPFLILFSLAPTTLRFARHRPLFLIVALALFSFVATMILFDSLLILGENQVLPPLIAMWAPVAFALFVSLPKYFRL